MVRPLWRDQEADVRRTSTSILMLDFFNRYISDERVTIFEVVLP